MEPERGCWRGRMKNGRGCRRRRTEWPMRGVLRM
nr:MAG TPA_asm: hypothetical protein [Caudoviricetes sp.]